MNDFISTLEGKGLAPKTMRDIDRDPLGAVHLRQGAIRRWATENPCEGIDLPAVPEPDEIRFLTLPESTG